MTNQGQPERAKKSDRKIDTTGSDTLVGSQGNDSLFGGSGHDFYIYKLGDRYMYIDDESGLDTLVVEAIHSSQISIRMRDDGFMVVNYKSKPILEMRGVDLIQTTDGCYRVEDWIVK